MLSMTDFIEGELVEESEIEPITDQKILESFVSVQASLAQLDCLCEYQAIMEYCGDEIPLPALYQEYDVKDTIVAFFENVWDWLSGIVRGIINSCNRSTIARVITAIEDSNKNELKFRENLFVAHGMIETFLYALDEFARVLNDIKDGTFEENNTVHNEDVEFLKQLGELDIKDAIDHPEKFLNFSQGNYTKEQLSKISNMVQTKTAKIINKDELVAELKKIYELNIPVTGRKILKRMEFNKKDIKNQDKIDKPTCMIIRKAANNVAKWYDKYVWAFVDNLKLFCKDNEINYVTSKAYQSKTDNWKSRTFRDQSNPVGAFTSSAREIEREK